jgi:transposase InsO family protein
VALPTVIDLCNREVIGHAMAEHMRAELVCKAVDLAYKRGLVQPKRSSTLTAVRRTPTVPSRTS